METLGFTFAGEISVCGLVSLSEMGKKMFICITGLSKCLEGAVK